MRTADVVGGASTRIYPPPPHLRQSGKSGMIFSSLLNSFPWISSEIVHLGQVKGALSDAILMLRRDIRLEFRRK